MSSRECLISFCGGVVMKSGCVFMLKILLTSFQRSMWVSIQMSMHMGADGVSSDSNDSNT